MTVIERIQALNGIRDVKRGSLAFPCFLRKLVREGDTPEGHGDEDGENFKSGSSLVPCTLPRARGFLTGEVMYRNIHHGAV